MIYDCFTFFNELDLLEIRLETLNDVVDKFVLVEATKTFRGENKVLYFKDNQERFAKFLKKIIYISCEFPTEMQSLPWECEFYQRNKLSDGLRDAKDNDLIVLSDVDEIPSPDVMGNFKKISQKNIVTVFDQRFFSYFLNCENKNRWCGSVIFSYHIFKKAPMQDVRKIAILCNALKHDRRFPYVLKTISEFFYMTILKAIPIQIIKGGWHFTSIGDIKNIQKKLHSFAHSEASSIADDEIATQRMINAGINIFNGKQESHFVKIDETFPRCLQNTEKFKKLIKEV